MNKIKLSITKIPLDFIGIMSSLLCAIHCAGLPLLLSMSAMASLHFLGSSWIEYSVLMISLFIALISFIPAYRVQHQKLTPILILVLGFVFIALGQADIVPVSEAILVPTGALLISTAHFINWRLAMKFVSYIRK